MVNENCDEIGSIKHQMESTQHDLRTHCDVHKLRNNHDVRDEVAVSGGGFSPYSNPTGIRTTDGTTDNGGSGSAQHGDDGNFQPGNGGNVNSKSISVNFSNSRIKAGPEPNCEVLCGCCCIDDKEQYCCLMDDSLLFYINDSRSKTHLFLTYIVL